MYKTFYIHTHTHTRTPLSCLKVPGVGLMLYLLCYVPHFLYTHFSSRVVRPCVFCFFVSVQFKILDSNWIQKSSVVWHLFFARCLSFCFYYLKMSMAWRIMWKWMEIVYKCIYGLKDDDKSGIKLAGWLSMYVVFCRFLW